MKTKQVLKPFNHTRQPMHQIMGGTIRAYPSFFRKYHNMPNTTHIQSKSPKPLSKPSKTPLNTLPYEGKEPATVTLHPEPTIILTIPSKKHYGRLTLFCSIHFFYKFLLTVNKLRSFLFLHDVTSPLLGRPFSSMGNTRLTEMSHRRFLQLDCLPGIPPFMSKIETATASPWSQPFGSPTRTMSPITPTRRLQITSYRPPPFVHSEPPFPDRASVMHQVIISGV